MSTLGGISRDLSRGRSLSVTAGAGVVENPIVDSVTTQRTAVFAPEVGVYFDREGSLLWAATASRRPETLGSVNIYPGVIRVGSLSPGLWLTVLREGGVRFGVATPWGLGVGRTTRPRSF
jgi:hypothetical protein